MAVAHFSGAVSEWLKEAVLKTVVPQGTGGSNPPCSEKVFELAVLNGLSPWSGAREAESGSLLRSCAPKGYRGFESPLLRIYEVVAQLDRASDCGSEGRTFESCQPQN
jgi:hypothetical protein